MEEERVCDTLQGVGEDYTGTRTLGVSQGVTQSTWAVACTVQGMHVTREVELPDIFAKPVLGAQAQIQEDFVGKAATLWPDSKHVPGLGGWGLGNSPGSPLTFSSPRSRPFRASDRARDDPVLGDCECQRMAEWTARLHVAEIEPFRKAVSSVRILSCIKISFPYDEQVLPQVLLLETLCLEQRFRNNKS
ncbi:unnamed protein product [Rangifer tarandus platyrhynchus]|uniref:Uncharacterized protein n=1 Tax=Rangifer tarandus platyrhynchus TaxID=3082113 RepID=A0ABN8ZCT6_RANTA|nr:unnamed protein product [Rangifer tarandus platyrhynchus]CAI9689139.1 unnamed protein product [Rangifer tarandus platyrhynchus]